MRVQLLTNAVETPTTRRIRLAVGELPYLAGQSASLSTGGSATPYSIASAPIETRRHGWVEFLVKVDGSSRFGAVVDRLAPGTDVELSDPAGAFTLDRLPDTSPLLFVAGGTGIAPMRSMIREAVETRRRAPLSLVYSSRTPDEFAYLAEFRELAEQGRLHLTLTLTGQAEAWPHARGRTAAAHLSDHLQPSTVAFLCGPPAMVTAVGDALLSLGVDRHRVMTETW